MQRKQTAWFAGALALASFALYARSLTFGFISSDDETVLLSHPTLYDEHSFIGSLGEILVRYFPREEPLLVRDISWAIDSRLFGFSNPFGYHLGNVVFNACNAVLLFLFLKHATKRFGFAAIVSGLWVCLPVHVEPVCWVMGRKDMLSTFFVLLALLTQSKALRDDLPRASSAGDSPLSESRRQRQANLVLLLLYVLAVLSKFSAVTLIVVLAVQRVLAEYLDGRAEKSAKIPWRTAVGRVMGLWPHAIIGALIYVWYNDNVRELGVTVGKGPRPFSVEHLTTLARFTPLVFGIYLRNLVSASQHALFYEWPSTAIALTTSDQVLSAAIAVVLVGLLVWAAKRRKDLFFYASVGLLLMVTYLNIVYIGIWVADRYIYLSSFCVLAIVVQGITDVTGSLGGEPAQRVARGFSLAAGGAFACYGIVALLRHEPAFRDSLSLWDYEVSRPHPSMVAMVGLAKHRVVQAEGASSPAAREEFVDDASQAIDRAEAHYRSIAWRPSDSYLAYSQNSYAELFVMRGRIAAMTGESEARQLAYYQEAFALSRTWHAAFGMERILFTQAARTGDERTASAALHYFEVVVSRLHNDLTTRQGFLDHLELDYRPGFPALAPQIDRIETAYLE